MALPPQSPARSLAEVTNQQPAASPAKGKSTKAELFTSPKKTTRDPEPMLDENPDRCAGHDRAAQPALLAWLPLRAKFHDLAPF